MCVGCAAVARMQKEIRNKVSGKEKDKGSLGGRRRETHSKEEAKRFISPWSKG